MFKISKENRDALLVYLLTRPMQEIEAGVLMLRNLEEIKEEKKDDKS